MISDRLLADLLRKPFLMKQFIHAAGIVVPRLLHCLMFTLLLVCYYYTVFGVFLLTFGYIRKV